MKPITSECLRPRRRAGSALLLAVLVLGAVMAGPSAAAGIDGRERDPVVLNGSSVPGLDGIDPESLVAFRRAGSGWRQIPVQVDERHDIDLRSLYPFDSTRWVRDGSVVVNGYSDPATLSGADPDPALDADDEIAMMAADSGPRAPAAYGAVPDGMKRAGATEVKVRETGSGDKAFIYLFQSAVPADQDAGRDYVDYEFDLLSGDYLSSYGFGNGPNPEQSTVETDFYSTGLSDRWINDELRLKAGGASGVDILDREKAQFGPGVCGRSTRTFSSAEGSFVVNRDGPVRAIRSFIGANSGPYTQREHVFYRRHQETRTFLRVHEVPGIMQFTDYSPEASGMTYRNAMNPEGVTIDGQPDTLVPGLPPGVIEGSPLWEQVSGPQGSLDIVTELDTDIEGLGITNYYLDDSTPVAGDEVQCTGDPAAYGTSGTWINTGIANTDPIRGPFGTLAATKTVFYEGPEASSSRAETRAAQVESPLESSASRLAAAVAPARVIAKSARKQMKVRGGRSDRLRVWVRNVGGSSSGRIKVCASIRGRGLRIAGKGRCRSLGRLAAKRRASLRFRVKAKRRTGRRGSAKVKFKVTENGRRVAGANARVRIS